MFFGSKASYGNDEDVYDFDVEKPSNAKSKSGRSSSTTPTPAAGHIAPFSPIPNHKSNKTVGFADETANNVRTSSESALDRAKSLMDKYSQKNTAPVSNFKMKRTPTFDEDDLSLSMDDEEPSGTEASESYNVSDSYLEKPKPKEAQSKQSSQATSQSKPPPPSGVPPPQPAKANNPLYRVTSKAAVEESTEDVEEGESGGYSDEEFDNDGEELEESIAKDEDASYSRIGYGVEEDEEGEDVQSESVSEAETSKPKILSFADFAAQPADWASQLPASGNQEKAEEDNYPIEESVNTEQSYDPIPPSLSLATKENKTRAPITLPTASTAKPIAVEEKKASTSSKATAQSIQTVKPAESTIRKEIQPALSAPALPPRKEVAPPPSAPSYTPINNVPDAATPHSFYPSYQAWAPPGASPEISAPAPTSSSTQPIPPPPPPPTAYPPSAYPLNYPYPPYPPAPSSHMPPYGYPPYPPHPSMAYGYPYPPNPYPSYPPDLYTSLMLRASSLPPSRPEEYSAPTNRSSFFLTSASQVKNDPTVMELMRQLNQAQEEANWAKKQLADMMVKVKATPAPSNQQPSKSERPPSGESEDSEDEYSEDFEISRLNTSTSKDSKVAGHQIHPEEGSSPQPSPTIRPNYSSVDPMYQGHQESKTSAEPNIASSAPIVQILQPIHTHPLDPLADSIAKSFLASQELLRTKLESLRMRIQFKDSMAADKRHLEDLLIQNGRYSTSSVPTLASLQHQFTTKRMSNEERLTQLLRESHPELKEAEVKELVNKYR